MGSVESWLARAPLAAAKDRRVREEQSREEESRATDAALIAAAQAGGQAAFEELVRRYDRQVLRLALNLTGSETEARDLYQEAFLKAYRNLGSFRFECSFYTWLYRIVSNVCMDYLRRRQVRKEEPGEWVGQDGETVNRLEAAADERAGARPDEALEQKELAGRIQRALAKLNRRERLVFEMKHYQGMKLREIGEALATSEDTAKNTLFRATQKLRAELAGWKG